MEQFEKDELPDRELNDLLHQWRAPQAPARLREAVFPRRSLWRRLWTTSIRIPLPVACALLLALGLGLALWPRIVVKTERVEVPVIQERVVYRDRETEVSPAWKPVAELRPRIIRSRNDQN